MVVVEVHEHDAEVGVVFQLYKLAEVFVDGLANVLGLDIDLSVRGQ